MTDKDVVPTYNGVLHSHNKNEILPFVTRRMMDLEGIILSEISQKKTNAVWFDLYVGTKKQSNKTEIEP